MGVTAARTYLGAGAAAIAVNLAVGGFQPLFDGTGLISAAVVLCAVAVHRPAASRAWVLFGCGQLLLGLGDVVYDLYEIAPTPSAADALYLAGNVSLIVAVVLLIARLGVRDTGAYFDAAVIALASGLLVWTTFLDGQELTGSVLARASSLASPAADLVLLFLLVRLVFVRGERTPSYAALVASVGLLLAADASYVVPELSASYRPGGWIDAAWMASYVLAAAAALHPTMRQIVRADTARPVLPRRRAALLGTALIALAVGAAVSQATTGSVDVFAFAGVGVVIITGVFTRIFMLIRDLELMRDRAEASERRFRLVFESAPIGISLGNDGIMSETNPAFQRLLGYTGDELAGMHFSEVTHAEDEFELQAELDAGSRGSFSVEKRYVRRDGTPVHVRAHIARATDGSFGIGLIEDVTERRQLENELRHSQKMDAVGKLAGGIAHDFNNLMTAVIGYSDILLGELADEPRRAERVGEIRKAAERASDLTRQLLAFSRKQMLRVSRVDLRDVAGDMHGLLSRVLGEQVVLDLLPSVEEVPVMVDRSQLEQVLMNLAVNARDAMPGGGRLSIAIDRDGDDAVLIVVDTGVGMSAEVRERIFEPFFSTKHPAEATGLGLSTVYGIVAQSGGSIDVLSVPRQGTTFVVRLPLASEAAVDGGEEPVRTRVPEADEHGEEQPARGGEHPAREAVQADDRHLGDVRTEERAA